jgi:ankyrin repeat protein
MGHSFVPAQSPSRSGHWESTATPLHEAADAGADPTITDSRFGSTPLGWAEHAPQTEAADLLRPHTPD